MTGRPSSSLGIVVTHFGAPPLWLPAFLISCRPNVDVEFLLYTDFPVPDVPPNVRVRHLTLDMLARRASTLVGREIDLSLPRKVCDLKPLYGALFADDLTACEFWAHADLDIVWGDIRRFVTDDVLAGHDVVSSRRKRTSGHFTTYRNDPETRALYTRIPGVADRLANPLHQWLDEPVLTDALRETASHPGGWPRVYWQGGWTIDNADQKAMGDADCLWWRGGHAFDALGQERMYLHFHKLKKRMRRIDFNASDDVHAFSISRSGLARE